MPLPLFIGALAAIAAVGGVGAGAHGAVKAKKANDTLKDAKERHKRNVKRFETENENTTEIMDSLGKLELEILDSFKEFSKTIERIQNKPEFDQVTLSNVKLPKYTPEELRTASVGAELLLGGLGGPPQEPLPVLRQREVRLPQSWHWVRLPLEQQLQL